MSRGVALEYIYPCVACFSDGIALGVGVGFIPMCGLFVLVM